MFTAFYERNDFSYAFEKIRNAISAPGENNVYAATELGLGILLRKYEQFRRELDAAGELGNHYVNTRRFGEKMGEASDLLDGVDNGLRYLLDCKAEWNQILDSF